MLLNKITIKEGTTIEFNSSELLFLAHSGQPYRGKVQIQFKSTGESFNLLDFKRYLTSLRAKTLYSEDIAHEIYTTINNSIKSQNLEVIVELTPRGGIRQKLSFKSSLCPTPRTPQPHQT